MRHPRAARTVTAALVLGALSACTDAGPPEPNGSPAAPVSAGPSRDTGWDCHVGTFRVTGIQSLRDTSTPLGDVRVAAAPGVLTLRTGPDGTWTMVADPRTPVTLQAGNVSGKVTVDGQVAGTYLRTGGAIDFTVTEVAGGVTSRLGDVSRTDPLDRFARAIAPEGSTTMACDATRMVLVSAAIRLTSTRITGPRGPPAGISSPTPAPASS